MISLTRILEYVVWISVIRIGGKVLPIDQDTINMPNFQKYAIEYKVSLVHGKFICHEPRKVVIKKTSLLDTFKIMLDRYYTFYFDMPIRIGGTNRERTQKKRIIVKINGTWDHGKISYNDAKALSQKCYKEIITDLQKSDLSILF